MTKEEALKILKGGNERECTWSEYCEAYNMAIQALEQEPKTMRSDSSKDDYNGNVNFRLFLEYCKILLTDLKGENGVDLNHAEENNNEKANQED